MPTFNQAVPDQGATKDVVPRTTTIQYGDGYVQEVADGINTLDETWQLSFTLRTKAVIQSIDDFLSAQKGVTSFDWTAPDGKTSKFVCKSTH